MWDKINLNIHSQKQYLYKEYSANKNRAKSLIDEGHFLCALQILQYSASIAYDYPILTNYIDDELEEDIEIAGIGLIKNIPVSYTPNSKNILLYSTTAVDFGALTEQYLYGLKSLGFNVLLVVSSVLGTRSAIRIKNYCQENDVEIFFPDTSNQKLWLRSIRDKVEMFMPYKIFIHSNPVDLWACIAFLKINVDTYFINHSDHTFWIGKRFFKFFIEFRNFGISLSHERRRISKDRIFKIPFYQIVKEDEKFKGLDFDLNDKIVLLSGGALYKYYLDPELTLFNHVKKLLNKYENVLFLLCGAGDDKLVKEFIIKNSLQNQFFYLGKRSDFSSLVSKAQILVESYPFRGGLVALYAFNERIPVLGISDNNSPSGSLEDFYGISDYVSPQNFEEFMHEASLLIENADYRMELTSKQKADLWTEKEFLKGLEGVFHLKNRNSVDEYFPLSLDDNRILSLYLKINDSNFRLWYNKVFYVGNCDGYIKGAFQLLKFVSFLKYLTVRSFGGLLRNYFII